MRLCVTDVIPGLSILLKVTMLTKIAWILLWDPHGIYYLFFYLGLANWSIIFKVKFLELGLYEMN